MISYVIFIFIFKLIFIGIQLLYNAVLVSAVQQSTIIHIHLSPLFQISFSFRSPQSTEQSSLCYTVGSHKLSLLYIVVYICQSQSPNSSHPLLPPLLCISLFSTSVSISALQIMKIKTKINKWDLIKLKIFAQQRKP